MPPKNSAPGICNRCGGAARQDTKGFYYGICVACRNVERRERYATDPNYRAAHVASRMRSQYGLSQTDYDEMLDAQNGRCAICGARAPGSRIGRFHIDHDHATGRVRSLLCHACNTALGLVRENVDTLSAMIQYLTSHGRRNVVEGQVKSSQ